jgi:hypothetical protein
LDRSLEQQARSGMWTQPPRIQNQVVLDDTIKQSDNLEKRNSNALEDKEEKNGNYNKGYKSDIEM